MQAQLFYTTKPEGALPVTGVTQEAWKTDFKNMDRAAYNCLMVQQFSGKTGEIAFFYDKNGCCEKVFLGCGEGNAALALAHAATRLPPGTYILEKELPPTALIQWALAQYKFDSYKKNVTQPRVLAIDKALYSDLCLEANAVFTVRDLINTPANDLGPSALSQVLQNLAKKHKAEFQQWVGEGLLEHNFPAIHAVGRAAADAPRLLKLSWGKKTHPLVTLVGKGVCFDSGGLDIKNSSGMRLMKKDMGGAAQVVGLSLWIMEKKLPIRLEVYIPAVENAVGSRSYRPGDVLTMRNGLTVEIDNTDAEGRLVLADALSLACEQKPEILFDFSTLTGAARTAVGTEIAAMFTNDDQAALDLTRASQDTADPLWRMPLYAGYANMLDSYLADMVNAGSSPYAGAITAALFLQRFITPDLPWVHFDIMAWNICNKPGKPEGGEAMGMRAVARYLWKRYGNKV